VTRHTAANEAHKSWTDAVTSAQLDTIPARGVSGRNSALTKVTSATSEYKVRTRLARWLRKQAETAGQRLFARDDLIAIQHGWQITTRYGGLGRRYRDPRFDTLPTPPASGEVRPDDWDSLAPVE